MPYLEEDFIMISALQHYLFCPRQYALIHLEQQWNENYLTVAGHLMHENVDGGLDRNRKGVRIVTSLRISSRTYGLYGVADVVEFHRCDCVSDESGVPVAAKLPGHRGLWRPFPVEYKHGAPKEHHADEVQLCAQALCLEEMLSVRISGGALFYGRTRHRQEVHFNNKLRELTISALNGIRDIVEGGITPPVQKDKRCEACSISEFCNIRRDKTTPASEWMRNAIDEAIR